MSRVWGTIGGALAGVALLAMGACSPGNTRDVRVLVVTQDGTPVGDAWVGATNEGCVPGTTDSSGVTTVGDVAPGAAVKVAGYTAGQYGNSATIPTPEQWEQDLLEIVLLAVEYDTYTSSPVEVPDIGTLSFEGPSLGFVALPPDHPQLSELLGRLAIEQNWFHVDYMSLSSSDLRFNFAFAGDQALDISGMWIDAETGDDLPLTIDLSAGQYTAGSSTGFAVWFK